MYSIKEALGIARGIYKVHCSYNMFLYHCRAMQKPMKDGKYVVTDEDIKEIMKRIQGKAGRPAKMARQITRDGRIGIYDRAQSVSMQSVTSPEGTPWREIFRFEDDSYLMLDEEDTPTIYYRAQVPAWGRELLGEDA